MLFKDLHDSIFSREEKKNLDEIYKFINLANKTTNISNKNIIESGILTPSKKAKCS
jgi:hypothetical protein